MALGKKLYMFIVQVSCNTELLKSVQYCSVGNLEMVVEGWNVERLCVVSIWVNQETDVFKSVEIYFAHLLCRSPCMQNSFEFTGILVRRWSWNSHSLVTLGKALHIHMKVTGRLSSFHLQSTTHQMVLKWAFIYDTGEETQHIHCWSHLGLRALWARRFLLGRW